MEEESMMAKIRFRNSVGLSKPNLKKLEIINAIIEEYKEQGYKLTLRQLYYQLVSRDIISNKVSEYAKLSGILVKGRMGGMVDWNAIEEEQECNDYCSQELYVGYQYEASTDVCYCYTDEGLDWYGVVE